MPAKPLRRVCTICARGGSKGVPNKNVRMLGGTTLIARTVRHAVESGLFDEIAVSSDSPEIVALALAAGVTLSVERPAALATDLADKNLAIVHCALEAERHSGQAFDTIVDLDVTAPFRTADDVRAAVDLLESGHASNVFSVMISRRSPYFNMVEELPGGGVRLVRDVKPAPVRRQDVPATYDMNASIYVWRRSSFEPDAPLFTPTTQVYVMPEERSLDIDSELDWTIAEALDLKQRSQS